MDKDIRDAQRRAEASNSVEDWRSYAQKLERLVEIPQSTQLYALFHEGDLYLDNAFMADEAVPYQEGDSKDSLLARHRAQRPPHDDQSYAQQCERIKGAWIFDEGLQRLMTLIWSVDSLSRDSFYEGRDTALRSLCKAWAVDNLKWEG